MILCLIAVFLLCGCSSNSGKSNSVLEFFGFTSPTQQPTPTAITPEQLAEIVKPTADQSSEIIPTMQTEPTSESKTGNGLADLDWDDFDPALVELDDWQSSSAQMESKSNEDKAEDDWQNDPYAWSFSAEKYQEDPALQGKQAEQILTIQQPTRTPVPIQPSAPALGTDPDPFHANPVVNVPEPKVPGANQFPQRQGNQYNYYRIQNVPVFQPMRQLPCTGLTAGMALDIDMSIAYTKTNMTLSIPTLNIKAYVVMVPLVEDDYPVEGLGQSVGMLEGSGPGAEDLLVFVGHNHIDELEQGPFAKLSAMKESDLIFIQGEGDASRTYVVYANEKFASDDIEELISYAKPGCMILLTCEDEAMEGGYLNRRVIFAEAKVD